MTRPTLLDTYLELHAARTPSAEALVGESGAITYGELPERVDAYAGALVAAGVAPGGAVGVFAGSRPEALLVFLACCRIGALYLGLNPKHTTRELEHVLGDAAPVLVVALHRGDDELVRLRRAVASIPAPPAVVVDVPTFLARGRAAVDGARADADAACAIVYTSGSTGAPKGALLSQRAIVRSAELSLQHWCAVETELRTVAQHPIDHVGWLVCECVVALLRGGRIVFRDRFDGEATLRLIERDRLTLWIAFPSMLMLALRSPGAAVDLGSLERLALGSSPSIQLLERFRARSSAAISTSYGLTEAGGGAVTATAADADLETIATTIGRPVAGIETRVVDGELLVRDSCLFLGYHNLPEATAAVLTDDGWLRTGDVVESRPDGNLRLTGRLSDAFKSGGHNVYPAEVERVLAAHADVEAAAVVAVPDPLWEEVGVAFVVLRPGSHLDAEDLRRHARAQLANYKVPKRVHLLPALPQLPNGKYDKRSLRERALLG